MKRVLCLVLAIFLLIASPVLAATYSGIISVIEANGTSYTMLPVLVDADITYIADEGYITATGLDTLIESYPHMLADDKILFALPIPANQTTTANFTTGNDPLDAFNIVLGNGGYVTITNVAGMNTDNWELEFKGYFDVTSTTNIWRDSQTPNRRLFFNASGNLRFDASPVVYVNATVTTGIHTIKLSDDGVNGIKLYVDGNLKDSTATNTNIAGPYYLMQGACVKYLEYFKHTAVGVLITNYQPDSIIATTVMPDEVGGNNNGTITWGANPAGVTASLSTFGPISESKPSSFSLTEAGELLTGTPTPIPQMYTDLEDEGFERLPGAEGINRVLEEADVPRALWWYPVVYISIAIVGMLAYELTTKALHQGIIKGGQQDGSLLLMCIIIEVGLALFGVWQITVFWAAILFPIPAVALLISRKHQAWG